MSRNISSKNLPPEGEKSSVELWRASSPPAQLHGVQTTANEASSAGPFNKSNMDDMRRRIVHLNKELEKERTYAKNLKRDKALEIRQVRDEEQKKAATMLADLRSKLNKEKLIELTSLREQLHKEKEKDIVKVLRQKDEAYRTAQQAWAKEKDEMKLKLRTELRSESREDTKREFEKERGRLEQEISDLNRQKKELEDTLKLVQDADKRKIDDIRRIHHEHESELEKFKRNSWQESRQQMAEIRQLLNIIEQLEKKLGLEAGHSMRLRLEKDSLHDLLKKTATYDAWDRMMSSTMKDEQGRITPPATSDTRPGNQELRMLQRKNVELSSLVRKLDEKNQQLATRNAELLAELESLEKDNRDKNRKIERKNADLMQTNKRLESRNKMLLDEINTSKKHSKRDGVVKPRGHAAKEQDDLDNLRAQLREQTRIIADLKQDLMDKDRRIELLRGRRKKSRQQTSTLTDFPSVEDEDALSVHSDFSEASEMSTNDDVDSKRIKKLAKELLALERAYALLQAHVGSAVDAERDEMEKQQLQSDLLESQTRIHELERMIDYSGQNTVGSVEMSQLQEDNKDLYQKLVQAEKDRDHAQAELAKHSEDIRELKDQRDLLEFELEEMSQLSTAGSEEWDSRRPRSTFSLDASLSPEKGDDSSLLSLEEVKSCLEELENEKESVLSSLQQKALKQARDMLESMAEKIHHMEITEHALRDKVRDLDLGYNSESLRSDLNDSRNSAVFTCNQETVTDLQGLELDIIESFYKKKQFEQVDHLRTEDQNILTEDRCCTTELVLEDLISMENIYNVYLNGPPREIRGEYGERAGLETEDKECMTDLDWPESEKFDENSRNRLDDFPGVDLADGEKGEVDRIEKETMTYLDLEELQQLESNSQSYLMVNTSVRPRNDAVIMTDVIWEELIERTNKEMYSVINSELDLLSRGKECKTVDVGIVTDLALSELAEMESNYFKYVENEPMVSVNNEELVEALPEVVLDTFPEDLPIRKDDCVMTELRWDDITDLENRCYSYERDIEELENTVAEFYVEKDDKNCCTDLSCDDISTIQEKCVGYECHIEELERRLAQFDVERIEQGTTTEMSLKDLSFAKFDVEMKDADTMTHETNDLNRIGLPQMVQETFPGEVQTKDKCDMTDDVWEEVEQLKNTYLDYRQNLEDMKNKLAQFEVEKDDKESLTDIAMQDLADLESLYKEHLREVDSDTNSLVSHAERDSRECMTELTGIEIAELEDFYIENAAHQLPSSPVVEKWEQESMTDITLDAMQYLDEDELHRQKVGGAGQKENKCTETDLTTSQLDYMEGILGQAEFLLAAEKVSIATITELTLPDLEELEDIQERHQCCRTLEMNSVRKEDKDVSTEMTFEHLKYLEEIEASQKEYLIDLEEKTKAEVSSIDKEDVQIMTEFTMMDLQYLEVGGAHENCLRHGKGVEIDPQTSSVEVMTDLTVSDLQYLEEVEQAHEECLTDKEEELKAIVVEKQNAVVMTDLTVSDLQYLEEVEQAHEECLIDKEEELKAIGVEKQNVEVITELTLSDLQYLEELEQAHEECAIDKEEERKALDVGNQNAEVMTDLTVCDLQYLENVEQAHEECLTDKGEDPDAKMESVEIMTDLSVVDLQCLETRLENFEKSCKANEKASEKERRPSFWRKRSRSASFTDHVRHHKNTMTDVTVNILEYYEDVEALYKETVVEMEELKTLLCVDKKERDVMTDLTAEDLEYLQEKSRKAKIEEEEKTTVNKEMMTELALDDLESLIEAEGRYKDLELEREKRDVPLSCDAETVTELTLLDMEFVEEELERLKQEHLQETDSTWVVTEPSKQDKNIMTEFTQSDLQHMEEAESLYKENITKPTESACRDNAGVMTDLTIPDIEYLEEAENLLKTMSGDVGGLAALLVPKDDKEVITDLVSSDIDYLELLGDVYRDENRNNNANLEKNDKGTETELTISDIRDLEDQVHGATEVQTARSFQGILNDNFQPQTLASLQSELEYLPILDEPEFVLDDEDEEVISRRETEVMTELTIADIRDLEDQVVSSRDIKASSSVKEDFEVETLDCLQSQLEYLPVLEEPEFVLDEDDEGEYIQRQDIGVMTEITLSDLESLLPAERDSCEVISESNAQSYERQDNACMTELKISDLECLEISESQLDEEGLNTTVTSESGTQCDLENFSSLIQELNREAEEHAEDIPAWFVTALNMRRPDLGFNPIHLVVRQSDVVPTDQLQDRELPSECEIEKSPLPNTLIDSNYLSEHTSDSQQLEEEDLDKSGRESWTGEKDGTFYVDVSIQCELIDVVGVLAEHQKDANEGNVPLSSVDDRMTQDDAEDGSGPLFTSRDDSDSALKQTDGPIVPPSEAENSDVLTDMPRRHTAINRFDRFLQERKDSEMLHLQNLQENLDEGEEEEESEERDVLIDMPQDSSAVNKFDRFLMERQDSEMLNLETLKETLETDDSGVTVDAKKLKELEDENEVLKRQIQLLENTQNSGVLEEEMAVLKEQVEAAKELKEENQLLREEIQNLRETATLEELEEENGLLIEKIKMLEEVVVTDKDVKAVEKENEELREKIRTLEESMNTEDLERENDSLRRQVQALSAEQEVSDQDVKAVEKENEELREKVRVLVESTNTEDLERENDSLRQQVQSLSAEKERAKEVEEENQIRVLEMSTNIEDLLKENSRLKEQMGTTVEAERVKELEAQNETLREKLQEMYEESAKVEDLFNENCSLRKQVEINVDPERMEELRNENEMLKEKVLKMLEESSNVEVLVKENLLLKQEIKTMVESERVKELEDQSDTLKEQLQQMHEESVEVKKVEDENESLRERVKMLEGSPNVEDVVNENALLREQIEIMKEARRQEELEYENETLKETIKILEDSAIVERVGNDELMQKMQDLENSTAQAVERLEEENAILKQNIQILEDSTINMRDLENENTLLREKVECLVGSTKTQELEEENALLRDKLRDFEETSYEVDFPREELDLLQSKIEQLREAEKKIGELNEANMTLKERIDLFQMEKKNVRENWSEMDPSEQLGKVRLLLIKELGLTVSEVESVLGSCDLESLVSSGMDTPRVDLNRLGEYFEQTDRGVQAEFGAAPSILRLLAMTEDGSIPDHIAEELGRLKEENMELYEELMELRTKIKARQSAPNEAAESEHARLASGGASSLGPGFHEETITPQVLASVASEFPFLEEEHLKYMYEADHNVMPSCGKEMQDCEKLVSEPELVSARRNLDSVMDDIDRRIQDLAEQHDDMDRTQTNTNDLVVLDSDDEVDLPPLPESSPPSLPTEPPPDFPNGSPPVLDHAIEFLLRDETSPLRDAATLRASSRARSRSQSKTTSQASSRVESPVTVEENTVILESEPSQLGGMLQDTSKPRSSSFKNPSSQGSTKVPPQVLPKPKRTLLQMRRAGELHKPLVLYENPTRPPSATSQWSRDKEDGVIPPRGIVLNRASSINRGEIGALKEKVEFLEKQLKNKENVIRSMKTEASELETKSQLERKEREMKSLDEDVAFLREENQKKERELLTKIERKEREMKILDEDVAFLRKENQKKERELLTKIGELNKKNYEIEQWKSEANSSERERQRLETAFTDLQNQMKNLRGAELKLAELQSKYSGMEKQNFELSEKVKKLQKTEREFQRLENNIERLQAQVREMDIVEQDRDQLVEKIKIIENQRDDLLRKGKVVESERNNFLRNNKLMEMQKVDLDSRCNMLQKTNVTLNSRLAELERETKEAQTKMHDSQHERNFLQVQLDKVEEEKNEIQKRLAITTQERNSLENQVAELQDLNRDHVKLEDGYHTLRIKLAERTREKDEAELQIPTLKAKISLLKKACKDKDESINNLSEEIRELRHSIATSALDDLSKIRTYGYSPENFVKLSAQREQERQLAKREPKDLEEQRPKSKLEEHSQRPSSKELFSPSPPGTKRAKRFVVLFDYDPQKSPSSEHPELELKLKEGDFITVFGDMDANGYFEADLNGVRGLVPSLYVDEVDDDDDSDRELEELLTTSRRSKEDETPFIEDSEHPLKRELISKGQITSGTTSVDSESRQCMVALHDYNPLTSGVPGRSPHEQLSFKKGDVMTAHGDMDLNRFYHVDLAGQTGFVPGHLLEQVSSSSFLQPTDSRAPGKVLGLYDGIQTQGQPKASSTAIFTPSAVTTSVYPSQVDADVTPLRHLRLPAHSLPNVGLTRFKPSPEVVKLGPSPAGVVPASSFQTSQRPVPSVVTEKPVATAFKSSPSKQVVPVGPSRPRSSGKVRPNPPSFFRVLRPVNHDAMLLAWTLPELDEFGRSNGLPVRGYKIYANDEAKLEVRSPYMAKALVENLDLNEPIKFSIKTVAENGTSSGSVSATFNDTIKRSLLDSSGDAFQDSGDEEQGYRTFVALFDYDPFKSSPNPNPASELVFKEGDILKVFDTSRKDGFYLGKLKQKSGLVPSNFVEEVAVASPRRLAAAKKRQAALHSPARPYSRESDSSVSVHSPSLATKDREPLSRKVMVALYDYNPEVQSPQDNPDSELAFRKGHLLTVFGEMRADGFYHAEMSGQHGLVPGNFIDEYIDKETDGGSQLGRRVSLDKGRSVRHLGGLNQV
ncbi:golgin subfamily B member 1-like isoform X2 [Montipora capricornis]|uniref:golgin subfamily B member 1-like isoform X2 n=1 Tax=Montipora capricornis TaxID=246305 RepID=UPI0035F18C6D